MEMIIALVTITATLLGIAYMVSEVLTKVKNIEKHTNSLTETVEDISENVGALRFIIHTTLTQENETKESAPKNEKPLRTDPPCMYGEIWKPLVQVEHMKKIEDIYMVSNLGRVYNMAKKKFLREQTISNGQTVSVRCEDGTPAKRLVKVLVATTFIGAQDINHYKVVNCDNNFKNNAASNLRWVKIERGRIK